MAINGTDLAVVAANLAGCTPAIPYKPGGDTPQGMDCQGLVEYCMRQCGWRGNWKGSNAMYRACTWTGTPEDCIKEYGRIPRGALLFILEDDGGEAAKGYTDGLGNASHVGIYVGIGDGAVHASSSRGCVAWSKFHGKTIPHGGWNRVGIMADIVDYGMPADADQEETEVTPMTATVVSPGGYVRMRALATKDSETLLKLDPGTEVDLIQSGELWSKVSCGGFTGFIMTEFLEFLKREDDDMIQVSGRELREIYDKIGALLGLGG